jgi:hypothetical protein
MQVTRSISLMPSRYSAALILVAAWLSCMHSILCSPQEVSVSGDPGMFSFLESHSRALMHGEHEHEHTHENEHSGSQSDHDHADSTETSHADSSDEEVHTHEHTHDHSSSTHSGNTDHMHLHEDENTTASASDTSGSTAGSAQLEKSVVFTAEELQAAVQQGDAHIEVQAHLDLTGLELKDCGNNLKCILGQVPSTVKSIRVR